jgi:hypothetical protein
MPLNPPSPRIGVPRPDVGDVVNDMLFDTRVKWVAVVFHDTVNGEDRFAITPWITDPANATSPG